MKPLWLMAVCTVLTLAGCIDTRPTEGLFASTPVWRVGYVLLELANGHAVMRWFDDQGRENRRQEFTVELWSGRGGLQLTGADQFVLRWDGTGGFGCLGCAKHIPSEWLPQEAGM